MIFSDESAKIYSHPFLRMAVFHSGTYGLPEENELMTLPGGSSTFYLPGRLPVGFDPLRKKFRILREFEGKKVFAAAAFLIPAYLRLHNPATFVTDKKILPLWAYTAAGFYAGRFYVTARRIDNRIRQSPRFYDNSMVQKKVKEFLWKYPGNRIYKHLSNCALNYNCLAAKNLFLTRWEAPLPTARFCNAKCLGCLSQQEKCCIASHERIKFKPRVQEIAEVAANHLREAREAIVSFGQGCEGEPLLEADSIAAAISRVRENISRGTINMNTNGSIPGKVKLLCQAGIDSFRISLNSPCEKFYNLYFKPVNYKFSDVLESIRVAKKYNKFVSINLFVFPGFTDSEKQVKNLIKFIEDTGIDMIQWRNLNIDPDYYREKLSCRYFKPQGVLPMTEIINSRFPHLKTGYFNLPKEKF